ncbi:putative uncharacterized protein DDB_G0282133 [Mytilus edulis]|uniref:putative uncharacterized protein DDB_G0282133 n=1 Tax=Mytilus edulis TaxID=6550 RepID=UPI0039F14BC8
MNNTYTEIRVEIFVEKSILLRDNYSEDGKIISVRETIESIDEFLVEKGNTYIKEAKNNNDSRTALCNKVSQNKIKSYNHTAKSHKFVEKSIDNRRTKNTSEVKNNPEKRNCSDSDVNSCSTSYLEQENKDDSLIGRHYVFQSLNTSVSEHIQQLVNDTSENLQQRVIDTTENTQQLVNNTSYKIQHPINDTPENTQQQFNDTTENVQQLLVKNTSGNVQQLVHDTTESTQQLINDTTESSELNESSDNDGSSSGFFSDDEMEFDDGINQRIKYSKFLNCKHKTRHVSKRRSLADTFQSKTKNINKRQRVLKSNATFTVSQHKVQSILDTSDQTHKVQQGCINVIGNLDNMNIQETCLDTMNYILDHIECEWREDKKYELRLESSRSCLSKRCETSTVCSTGAFGNSVADKPTSIESNEIITNFKNKKSLLVKKTDEKSKCKKIDIKREIDDLEPGEIRDEVDSTKKDKHKTSAHHSSSSLKRYLLTRRGTSKYISYNLRYSSRYIRGRYSRGLRGRRPYRGRSQSHRSLSRGRSLPPRETQTSRNTFDRLDYSDRRGVDYETNESTTDHNDLRNRIEANERRPYSTDKSSFRSLRSSLYRGRNYSRYGTLQHMRKPYESVSDYIRKYRTFESKCESDTPYEHYQYPSTEDSRTQYRYSEEREHYDNHTATLKTTDEERCKDNIYTRPSSEWRTPEIRGPSYKNLTITRRFSTGDERSKYTRNEKRNYRSHSEYFETSPYKHDRYIYDESRRQSPGQREERASKERASSYKRERHDNRKEEREYDRKESTKHEKQVSNERERNSSRKSVSGTDSLKSEQVKKISRISRHATDENGTSSDEHGVRISSVVTIAPTSQQDIADKITASTEDNSQMTIMNPVPSFKKDAHMKCFDLIREAAFKQAVHFSEENWEKYAKRKFLFEDELVEQLERNYDRYLYSANDFQQNSCGPLPRFVSDELMTEAIVNTWKQPQMIASLDRQFREFDDIIGYVGYNIPCYWCEMIFSEGKFVRAFPVLDPIGHRDDTMYCQTDQ